MTQLESSATRSHVKIMSLNDVKCVQLLVSEKETKFCFFIGLFAFLFLSDC